MIDYAQLDEMFCQGCAFADCSDLIGSMPNSFYLEYTSAQVANASLSAEIFLKVLLKHLDVDVGKSHKLSDLFNKLPPAHADAIRRYVYYHTGEWNENNLQLISNAFVDWRYSYEHNQTLHMPLYFLTAFRDGLREHCATTIFGKTWDEYKDERQRRIIKMTEKKHDRRQ